MQHETKPDLEAALHLKKLFLKGASAIAGNAQSSPEATKCAGNEAARLKTEIAALEQRIQQGDYEEAAA